MTVSSQINSTVEYLKSTVTLSSANLKAMYATPVLVLAAQGPHTIVVLHDVFYEYVFTTPAYTGGSSGTFILQFNNTIHGGSANPAAFASGLLTNTQSILTQSLEINLNLVGSISSIINTAIYASNTTAAYATGNGLVNITMFYSIINTVS